MTSIIHEKARVGANVRIGDYCKIFADAVIQDDVTIEDYCSIGNPTPLAGDVPLILGRGAHVRSHSILYQGSTIGDGMTTGHHVTIRELADIGQGFQLGTGGDVQGHCTIGNFVKTHSGVQINHRSVIEDFVWLFPRVQVTNDPHPPSDHLEGVVIRKYAAIGACACLVAGIEIGEGALVAAGAVVAHDVEPAHVVAGVPARDLGLASKIRLRDGSGAPAYPWRRHFHRGYPPDVVAAWLTELGGP
jgi:acetyltransferase-like isoleucine patch superfamily enzyme